MMGVPSFQGWKVFLWNRKRQRYMIEKKVIPDWITLQEEAQIADHLFRVQFELDTQSNANSYTSHYCMKKMLSFDKR